MKMRIGSSLDEQAARPTELGSAAVGDGVGFLTSRTLSLSVVSSHLLPVCWSCSKMEDKLLRTVGRT